LTTILDGKLVAAKLKEELTAEVKTFTESTSIVPGLATVLVGENPASQIYVKNKIKTAQKCGIKSTHHQIDETISEEDLLSLVDSLNKDKNVHGILVQLPLPSHISEEKIINAINSKKDVDGFHPENMGRLLAGYDALMPCTPSGVMEIFKHYKIELKGKDVLIIGRSNIVGKPQAIMILKEHATVTLAHSRTIDLSAKAKAADIIIAAVGKAKMVKKDWVKEGAVVVDVGMNRDENGKLCGDVDFEGVKEKAAFITPVPGGVGPMTITMLMKNTLKAARQLLNEK